MNKSPERDKDLWSARASRAGFGAPPKQAFSSSAFINRKVRDGEGAIASTRGRVRSPERSAAR